MEVSDAGRLRPIPFKLTKMINPQLYLNLNMDETKYYSNRHKMKDTIVESYYEKKKEEIKVKAAIGFMSVQKAIEEKFIPMEVRMKRVMDFISGNK